MGTLFKFGKQDSNRANERGAASRGSESSGHDRAATAQKVAAPGSDGGLFAREQITRQSMIRFSLWGVSGLGALLIAILASNATMSARRMEQAAAQQVASLKRAAEDNEIEARRLSAAIRTLNTDRDRLYTRLTVVEKNLEDVTGTVSKQAEKLAANAVQMAADPAMQKPPQVAPVASIPAANVKSDPAPTPSPPAMASAAALSGKTGDADTTAIASNGAAPLPQPRPASLSAAGRDPLTTASTSAQTDKDNKQADKDRPAPESAPVARAAMPTYEANGGAPAFGADLGGAKSIAAIRSFWRSMSKKYPVLLGKAQPLMAMRERKNGLGMELRLIAGPLMDQGMALNLCRELEKAGHGNCAPAPYDGQRIEASNASLTPDANSLAPGRPESVKPENIKSESAKSESAKSESIQPESVKDANDKASGDPAATDKTSGDKASAKDDSAGSEDAKPSRAAIKRARNERAARVTEPVREPVRNAAASRSPLEKLFNLGR